MIVRRYKVLPQGLVNGCVEEGVGGTELGFDPVRQRCFENLASQE